MLALSDAPSNRSAISINKVELMHGDLVHRDGQLTITTNMNNSLVSRFLKYFTPSNSVQISNFVTRNKGDYDRVDAKYCIVLQ